MDEFSCNDLCDVLHDMLPQEHCEPVICQIRQHSLTGKDLECLSNEELAEVFPVMGIRKSVVRAVSKIKVSVCLWSIYIH